MKRRIEAYAKLNVALRVIRRRDDGFHEIDSLVQTIDLCDEIRIERAEHPLEVRNTAAIEGRDLAEVAARRLLAAKGTDPSFRILIEKRIPIGAGLGGGSSDAATVLNVLDVMTPPSIGPNALREIAAEIGSDVSLFLEGGLQRIRGRGEWTGPVASDREEHYVVIVPPVHCATGPVYAAWKPAERNASASLVRGENDLLTAAISLYPELAPYRDAAQALSAAYWGMSGSGSSFYAAFKEGSAALAAATYVAELLPSARVFTCRAVDSGHRVIEETS